MIPCDFCGNEFAPTRHRRRYCTRGCSARDRARAAQSQRAMLFSLRRLRILPEDNAASELVGCAALGAKLTLPACVARRRRAVTETDGTAVIPWAACRRCEVGKERAGA